MMNKSTLQTYRRKLEKLAARLQPLAKAVTEQTLSPSTGQGTNELSNLPLHTGDGGTEEYLHDLNATLMENEAFLISEVNAAINRIDGGTYGRCEHCARSIARARLDALPFSRYCRDCAAIMAEAPPVSLDTGRPRGSSAGVWPEEEEQEGEARDEEAAIR